MKVPRVNRFTPEARAEVERRLLSGDFESYRKFSAEIQRRFGHHIKKSALQAHRQRLLRGAR
jgi:hypothetical protein